MTNEKTVFMFSGQGSQYFQMGRELFDQDAVFRACMLGLDDVVRRASGMSVVETLYFSGHNKAEPFDRTALTHPAIFMTGYSLAQALIHGGTTPDLVLGASLGSFAAAAVAGLMTADEALGAVIHQAAALETCCEPGGMVAILADPKLYAEDFLAGRSELAAVNFSTHFVVAARTADLASIETELRKRGVSFMRLPVSFAFHSRWIDEAQRPFESFMRSIAPRPGSIPLVCCVQGGTSLMQLPTGYFWRVAREPIRFREAVARLEQQGACRYIDVGPAGTLATFLKYSLSSSSRSTMHPVLTPYGRDAQNLSALLASNRG